MPARERQAASGTVEVEAILVGLPDDQRAALEHLRRTIAAVAPDATDGISYGAAAFRYRGRPLVAYGAAKRHCALYVMAPDVIDAHRDRLVGFDVSKGTIRFEPDRPLPDDLVESIIRARVAQTDAAAR